MDVAIFIPCPTYPIISPFLTGNAKWVSILLISDYEMQSHLKYSSCFSNVLTYMLYNIIKRQSRLLILNNLLYFANSYMPYFTCLVIQLRNGKDTNIHYLSISKGSQFWRNKEFIECSKILKFKVPCAYGTKWRVETRLGTSLCSKSGWSWNGWELR